MVVSDGVNWARLVETVEPDDRDVARGCAIPRLWALWRTPSAIWSLAGEDAVEVRVDEPAASSNATSPLAEDQSPDATGPGSSPASAQRIPPAVVAVALPPASQRTARDGRSVVDRGEQVLGGLLGAAVVVDDDRRERGRRARLEEHDRRRAGRQLLAARDVGPDVRSGEDDPLDTMGDQELDDRHDLDASEFDELLEEQRVPGRLGLLGDPVERLGHPEVAEARRDRRRASATAAGRGCEPPRSAGTRPPRSRPRPPGGCVGDTSGRLLMTRDTVCVDTPHIRAISLIVTLCWRDNPTPLGRRDACAPAVPR